MNEINWISNAAQGSEGLEAYLEDNIPSGVGIELGENWEFIAAIFYRKGFLDAMGAKNDKG